MTSRGKGRHPAGRQVHIDQQSHDSTGEMNFASLGKAGGEGKSLADVLLLEVGEISQQFFDFAAGSNRFHDHADGYPHSSNARFAAHHVRIDRNAAKFLHVLMIAHAVPLALLRSAHTSARQVIV
jgi:hypothetical protein